MDDYFDITEDALVLSNGLPHDIVPDLVADTYQEASFVNAHENLGAHQLPPRQRRSTIADTVWDTLKPIIEELYIHQGLPLTDVMARMKQQYGFDASDKMYKKRFRDWHMRKNSTQALKQEFISKITQQNIAPDPSPLLDPNGKPLQAQRLLRKVQRKGARVSLVDRQACTMLQRKHLLSARVDNVCHVQLQQSCEAQHTENILRSARTYYSWYSTQNSIKVQYGLSAALSHFMQDITNAVVSLRTNSVRRGFALLNRCCSGLVVLLKEQPFQLLQRLIHCFAVKTGLWGSYCDVQRTLLKIMASSADVILGTTHPITTLMASLTAMRQEHMRDLACRYAELLADTTMILPDAQDSTELLGSVAEIYLRHGQLDNALKLCQSLWDAAQPISSPPSAGQLYLLLLTAGLAQERKDYGRAEQVLRLGIGRDVQDTGKRVGNVNGIRLCYEMARLYADIGRFAESERFYRTVIESVTQWERHAAVSLVLCSIRLGRVLEKQGKVEESALLREPYDQTWAELEPWELRHDPDELPPDDEVAERDGNAMYHCYGNLTQRSGN
ncbi:hypothetical protein CLCR_11310 [Cladophialophora carrionii]|uniref:Clr5 domain-containing protein n=1 Tax=Cladophialophora carrionii TaxID=86049 RepID=A0A1C1CLF5_9EURO|nr:hypothetical protein CLCR_11310 [Cladophialophora carrionii]